MSKIKFNLTPQEHIKEIKECGEKFTGSQYYCLYKEDIEKLVKYSEKRDKEIERLTELCNKYEEEHKTTFETWQKDIKENEQLHSIIKEAREYITKQVHRNQQFYDMDIENILEILDKVEEK